MSTLIAIGKILAAIVVIACVLIGSFILVLVAPVIFCYALPFIIVVVIWRTLR